MDPQRSPSQEYKKLADSISIDVNDQNEQIEPEEATAAEKKSFSQNLAATATLEDEGFTATESAELAKKFACDLNQLAELLKGAKQNHWLLFMRLHAENIGSNIANILWGWFAVKTSEPGAQTL